MDKDNNNDVEEYRQLVRELRGLFKEEYSKNEELYLRQDYDRIMDTDNDWNCGRYLNHFYMDLNRAFEKMKETLQWRKDMKINEFSSTSFPKELWLYSPFFACGHSKDNCAVIYLLNSQFRVIPEPLLTMSRNYFLYYLEQLERTNPAGEKIHVVFDETNSSLSQIDLSTARWLISIRDYWPDRIQSILVVGLPFVFRPIFRMIISWLPKEWRNILIVGSMKQLVLDNIDPEELPWFLGGSIGPECRLAPVESKWASEMSFFKDKSVMDALYETVCFHASEEERELLKQLQSEHDAKSIN